MVRQFPAAHLKAKDFSLQLRPGQPPVSFDDLAAMLELEILLGRKHDFLNRLDRAIVAAYRLGGARLVAIPKPRF